MAATQSALGRFFGGLLHVYRIIRSIFFNLIFLLLVLIFITALIGQPPVVVRKGTTLLINPAGTLVEQESFNGNPLSLLSGGNRLDKGQVVARDLQRVIAAAKSDDRIKSILLMTDSLEGAGLSQLLELEQAIADFRTSGKKVIAWGSNFHQGQYLLASAADEVIMNDFGEVGLEGFGIFQNYYHDALDKLGVNVHIFRVGAYKSAVEPYSRNDMSAESRSNYTKLLDDLWSRYSQAIEQNRKLMPGAVNDYINHYDQHLSDHKGNAAELAKASGLVDRLSSRPEVVDYLKQQIGTRGGDLDTIDYRHYLRALPSPGINPAQRIAVIVADGEIVDGESQGGSIGGETMANLIRDTAKDTGVKALVLRVNSPGGSAFASELIRAEVAAFKASGRPVVVSMGDTAASGGYWISTAADKIVASPTTLTGSIGIFGVGFTLENSFSKIGVGTDGVGTTALAGYGALGRPLPDIAGRVMQQQIQYGYEKFLTLVSAARDMDRAQVDAVAQGQVWSGQSAFDRKLVDQLGNFDDAVKLAASLAKLDTYSLDLRQAQLSPLEQVVKQVMEKETVQRWTQKLTAALLPFSPTQRLLLQAGQELDWVLRANDRDHVYARCLECAGLRL
ncbi:MAG TPA: signal peptide peptidase SppA [Candidatus Acidoferrum sp.]|nr:signal peptide peptidase SppA [Candidatus Acidoferrum sp.]